MFCPKCGRINPDENEICKGCGASLHTEDEVVAKKGKGSPAKKMVISLAIAVLVCIVVFVLLHILG